MEFSSYPLSISRPAPSGSTAEFPPYSLSTSRPAPSGSTAEFPPYSLSTTRPAPSGSTAEFPPYSLSTNRPAPSGSTVEFPPYPLSTSTAAGPNSSTTADATAGSSRGTNHPYAPRRASQNYEVGVTAPVNNAPRVPASPQQHYPDNVTVAESHYSDDRHRDDLVRDLRKARMESSGDSGETPEYEDDYKVQVGSDYGDAPSRRPSEYVPPPSRSTTVWSTS